MEFLIGTAYAMFAVVRDTNNFYRWYQSGDSLVAESKIGGAKKTLADSSIRRRLTSPCAFAR